MKNQASVIKKQGLEQQKLEQQKQYPITAGILAGGKSSRMGENKAFLPWRGTTVLAYEIELFKSFSQTLVSVAERKDYDMLEKSGIILVEDVQKEYGPLEGIYQLLKHARNEWVFIMATDMPMVNATLISGMTQIERQGVQAVVIKDEQRVQPLCGLYHKSILPVLEQLFEASCHSLFQLLERISVKYVQLETLHAAHNVLMNVNTPEEYHHLIEAEKWGEKDESCSNYIQ